MSKQPVSPQVITKLLSYDYKNAAEKILFTVIGILIALWINHCDESYKKKNIEIQALKEIATALKADLEEANSTINGVLPNIRAVKKVIAVLQDSAAVTDSLPYYLAKSFAYSFYLPNTAAYETLKSRGMETITNDSVRLAIAQLYSVTYEYQRQVDALRNTYYMNYVAPYYVNHFQREGPGKPSIPVNWDNLKNDHNFLSAMALQRDNYTRVVREYKDIAQHIAVLQLAVEKELKGN